MAAASIRIETRLKTTLLSISLEVEHELLALVGRSGSGKTMILRAIAGVYTPDSAVIEIDGHTIFSSGLGVNVPPGARHIGYVPQSRALYPHLSIFDNVAVALSKQQVPEGLDVSRRVAEVLDLLALWRVRTALPDRLDPLTLQRVALARAIVGDPALLLMDEPFATLPEDARRDARSEFVSLRRQLGVPTIFATGELEEAYEIADRIALLEAGSIAQVDEPRTLLTRPANRLVAEMVRSVNVLPGVVLNDVDASESGEVIAVRTSLGVLQVAGQEPFTTRVDLTIRPEQIVLIEPGDRRENAIQGEITSATRHGSYVAVVVAPVDLPEASPIHLFVSEHVFRERSLDVGSHCAVALPPAAIHLMPRD